jgi:hypothetical protein
MGRACGMYAGDEKYMQNFGVENLKERDHLEDLGTDRRIILNQILKK